MSRATISILASLAALIALAPAASARFMQTDPVGYQDQMNLYTYVANDPTNKVDPTGNDSVQTGMNFYVGIGFGVKIKTGRYEATSPDHPDQKLGDPGTQKGSFTSVGWFVGAGIGIESETSQCASCVGDDIGGRSAGYGADIPLIGGQLSETAVKEVPMPGVGMVPQGGTGKIVVSVSTPIGASVQAVGVDYTTLDPDAPEPVDIPIVEQALTAVDDAKRVQGR